MTDGQAKKSIFEILCCPACDDRPRVEVRDGRLICDRCGRAYPIRDGIPVMLVEEAEILEETR